ncbi:MAG: glycoside hydrolase family 3 C-terminal domain-containing protein [Pseudomonadota bacterium]
MLRPAFPMLIVALLSHTVHAAADEFSPRVRTLVSQMTLDEKLAVVQGGRDPAYAGEAGYIPGVARLGIPALRLADGPANVFNRYETTALPQPISLAATFSTDLAARYGELLGREARATRTDVLLGPMVNIMRLPNWGRNVTSSGEDPFLIGQIAAAEVLGIQSTGTLANAKHFLANNQALHQGGGLGGAEGANFVIDERTLHEIYLPGFESVLRAGVASVMASYNRTNGFWNAENAANLTQVLRQELGWNGFVVSDWHANRSTQSINAGLDMEMPGPGPQYLTGREGPKWGPRLKAAVEAGQVNIATLDRAVSRVVTQMERFGMLDGKREAAPEDIPVATHAEFARTLAAQGAVLLKNAGAALPLTPAMLKNIVVIGPTAAQLAVGPGVSGFESRFVSPLDALRAQAGDGAKFEYVAGYDLTGSAIPTAALIATGGSAGLTRQALDGSAAGVDAKLDFVGADALPTGRGYTWKAMLHAPASGDYTLAVQSWGGSGMLKFQGEAKAWSAAVRFGHGVPRKNSSVIPTRDGLDNAQTSVKLEAGKTYAIEVEGQAEPEQRMQIRLAWITPQMRDESRAAAVAAAKNASAVLLFAWARSGEFDDPDLALRLPDGQDAFVDAVASANRNTIVVLNSSSPHDMPWLTKVRAVLQMWFPGQEGGWATTDVLLGKANPGGHLPMTFPVKATDNAALDPRHPERYNGVANTVTYSEGIFTGYRHFDESGITPLFPFGYGLSYTTFDYSALKVTKSDNGLNVVLAVKNTGKLKGSTVPQVYVGRPARTAVAMAPQVLAAFTRLELAPGESRSVQLHVARRQLSYWSVASHSWEVATGARPVRVGVSSRDIRLTTTTIVE